MLIKKGGISRNIDERNLASYKAKGFDLAAKDETPKAPAKKMAAKDETPKE